MNFNKRRQLPKFSIIIVSYNSSNDLDNVFSCLDKQTNRDFEIILIDNLSPNFPPTETQKQEANLFIANEKNIGFARANNQGAKIAKGEYLILLNPDAFPKPDWLEEIDNGIAKYPNCENFGSLQLLESDETFLDGAGDCYSISGIAWRGGHRILKPDCIEDGECFSSCGAASVWKAARYLELGGFEESFESYFEDVDLGFRHRIMGGKCIQLSKAIVAHRGSGSSSRYSEYAVFYGTRNRISAYIRLMPGILFYICLPIHILASLILFLHSIYRGAGKPCLNGMIAGLKLAPNSFKQRKIIQKNRRASLLSILRVMSFSPIALLKRRAIIRKIK